MTVRRLALIVAALLAPAVPAAAAPPAATALPAAGGDEPPGCVRPVVESPARCTFDVWGYVLDSEGLIVPAARVSYQDREATSDERGFYDLTLPAPGSYDLTVASHPECHVTIRVDVDAYTSVATGGTRRDLTLPCARPTYNAFGFGVVRSGRLVAVARKALMHSGGAPGELEWYEHAAGEPRRPPVRYADTPGDDRDAAGGLTPTGALVVFFARFDAHDNRWASIGTLRTTDAGTTPGSIPIGRLKAFSPYGPLVALPSGRLMQTFYGDDGRTWRIYISFSNDDGRTWDGLTPIDVTPPFRATEAAAVYLDGPTDATARIVLVARARELEGHRRFHGLVQYTSPDGGRSWRREGLIESTKSRYESIPWIARLDHERLALVWADRGTLSIKVSVTAYGDALARRWRAPRTIYRSRVPAAPKPDLGDFGYPSIASYGPGDERKAVVFNDVDVAGSLAWRTDVDLYVLPLWADPSMKPTALSP